MICHPNIQVKKLQNFHLTRKKTEKKKKKTLLPRILFDFLRSVSLQEKEQSCMQTTTFMLGSWASLSSDDDDDDDDVDGDDDASGVHSRRSCFTKHTTNLLH